MLGRSTTFDNYSSFRSGQPVLFPRVTPFGGGVPVAAQNQPCPADGGAEVARKFALTALRQPVFDIVHSPKNCAKSRVCTAFCNWTRTGESTIRRFLASSASSSAVGGGRAGCSGEECQG